MAPHGVVRFSSVERARPNTRAIGVRRQPLLLNNGHFLRLLQSLQLDSIKGAASKLRVTAAQYQYQIDPEGERWVFRYEYLRTADDPHPSCHLHVRGKLAEHDDTLPADVALERVHFPTGRMSLEAVIRCLVEQFKVPTTESADIWRPILAESERLFDQIAHRPISGPAA
jgi:hypothetical protein